MNARVTGPAPQLAAGLDDDEADRAAFLELAARMIAEADGGPRTGAWNVIKGAAHPDLDYRDRGHAALDLGNALLMLDTLEADPDALGMSAAEAELAAGQFTADRDAALRLLIRGTEPDPPLAGALDRIAQVRIDCAARGITADDVTEVVAA